MKFIKLMPIVLVSLLGGDLYYYQNGEKVFIDKLKTQRDSKTTSFSRNGRDKSILNSILLKPKNLKALDKIKNMENLKFIEKCGDIYKFETKSAIDSLKISAKLYEDNLTEFSNPNFSQKKENRSRGIRLNRDLTESDFLNSSYSWHLDLIEAKEAWAISKGDGVKVAVYDDGVDFNHEDLKDNYLFGYNFDNSSEDVYPSNTSFSSNSDYHGTAVAGIIAASENDIGVIGVAPKSYLVGIKEMSTSDYLTVKAFNWAKEKNIDVINCSWGTYDVSDSVKYAIIDLATNGRNGKGALVVFAVGNDYYNLDTDLHNNKEINDESEIEEVIAVGGTDQYNKRSTFSNYGEQLDLVAPGGHLGSSNLGISSTDITGYAGDEVGNYILSSSVKLRGTSFSSPIVAGVIADILAVNPNLTRDEVKDILYSTAQKIGGVSYTIRDGYPFNEEYGYGLVNAKSAVEKALTTNFTKDIKSGWNLIGNINVNSLNTENLYNNFANIIYDYLGNNNWELNPTSIASGKGFWLKSNRDYSYKFENTGIKNTSTTTTDWQILIADKNIRLNNSNNHYYVYRDDVWLDYPNGNLKVIYKGEGYWIKER